MESTNVSFRLDKDLKERFEAFCDDVGMNMTTAFTMFIKASLRQNRIPFAIEGDGFYNEANLEHIRKGIDQIKNGETVTMTLDELRKEFNG